MDPLDVMTAREAAAMLGVSRATLYAYVSRGLVRSEPFGSGRQRRYLRADIDRLVRRRQGADPASAAPAPGETLLLPSAITLIADGRLSYRGHDAVALAEGLGLEEVARLLWQTGSWDPFAEPAAPAPAPLPAEVEALPPLARLQASLPLAEAADPQAVNRSSRGCARTGARLLRHALEVLAPATDPPDRGLPLHESLASRWLGPGRPPQAADLLRRALVLCADHEFNASTFTARCIAGTGASVYAAAAGAVAALRGPRHGGAAARVAAFLERLPQAGAAEPELRAAVAAALERGEDLPGFGHPLYPERDPRAQALLQALAAAAPEQAERLWLAQVAAAVRGLSELSPNVDFALVALARTLALPAEAPMALFALGRMAGWTAHVEEQYRDGRLVRPRALYTGPPPD